MSPYPPTVLIPLLHQPVMPQHLRVEIPHLERRMVHVGRGRLEKEKAVVVHELEAAVEVEEGGYVGAGAGVREDVGGFEVEVCGPEVEGGGEMGHGEAEVAEFVDLGGAFLESLEFVGGAMFFCWEIKLPLPIIPIHLPLRLPMHQMHLEPIHRIPHRHTLPPARRILHLPYRARRRDTPRRQLQILPALHHKRRAAEGVFLLPLCGAVDKWLGAVTSVVDCFVGLAGVEVRDGGEAEVGEELLLAREVGVGVVDVGEADEGYFFDGRGGEGRVGGWSGGGWRHGCV